MRIIMTKQNEVLQLKALGHSKSEVARITKIDRATVRKYLNEEMKSVSKLFR